jgi:putative peptide zinc metalloprotease protein
MTVLNWAAAKQLLQSGSTDQFLTRMDQDRQARSFRRLGKINLVSFKIPLGNPDPILKKMAPWLMFLTSPAIMLLWLIGGAMALTTLASHWPQFHARNIGFFSPMNLALLWFIWLGLKVIHELFHALVCYRYGGRIQEAGILFILFMPFTYVDATSSWAFPSRWQRLHVAFAGIFAELGIAWIALLLWAHNPDSTTGLLAHHTVIVAGISSLLFNANPLMRFDGYYILSDLTGIPNLYQLGLQSAKEQFARLFLNLKPASSLAQWPTGKRIFIRIYGVLVFVWRFLVLASLGYLASTLFGGLGIFITLAALLLWISSPLHAFIARWPAYREQNPHVGRDLLLRSGLGVALLVFLISTVSWQQWIRAPAVVEYEQQVRVRTGSSGFVETLCVKNGDQVREGEQLLVLSNPDLTSRLQQVELELEQLQLKSRIAYNSHQLPEMQILRRQAEALAVQAGQLHDEVAALTIKAPASGTVIAPQLDQLQGLFLDKGKEVLWIVSPGRKHLMASIAQQDVDALRNRVGTKIRVEMRASGLAPFFGTVKRISPTASTRLEYPGLAAKYGGPIDVLEHIVKSGQSGNEQIQLQFFQPRFGMEITLASDIAARLRPGQIGYVLAGGSTISLHQKIKDIISSWIRKKDKAAAAREQ